MERTVIEGDFNVNHRIVSYNAPVERLLNAFLNGRNKFIWNYSSSYLVKENETIAAFQRLDSEPAVSVLTASAGLFDIFSFGFRLARYSFFVGNLRTSDIGFNAEFSLHSVHDYFKVEFAHAGDDGLARFRVARHSECRVFVG